MTNSRLTLALLAVILCTACAPDDGSTTAQQQAGIPESHPLHLGESDPGEDGAGDNPDTPYEPSFARVGNRSSAVFELKHDVDPALPADLVIEAPLTIIYEMLITRHGDVQEAKILRGSGNDDVDRAVLQAIEARKYYPPFEHGMPVDIVVTATERVSQ